MEQADAVLPSAQAIFCRAMPAANADAASKLPELEPANGIVSPVVDDQARTRAGTSTPFWLGSKTSLPAIGAIVIAPVFSSQKHLPG